MNAQLKALVIDDEAQVREFVSVVLQNEGWTVSQSPSAEDAVSRIDEADWAVVFCDVKLGGADGYTVLRHFKEHLPQTKVVLMTGHGSAVGALDATAFGAYDYLLKPFGPDELESLSQTLRAQLTERPHRSMPGQRSAVYDSDIELVGRSQSFIEVMKHVGRVAATNLPVLLTGESGTGKELVASAIHRRSGRAGKSFVGFNCGAIPAELIEAELFGHVKGSFTGAERDRRGLWEEADGGTIFLDEITETSPSFQVKLLRVLQEGEIRRVGSNQTLRVDARVVAACNRDVEKEVADGRFRKDLFYRLNAVSIVLPPLRERPEDIPPLAQSFADRVYKLSPSVSFTAEALSLLQKYNWPGNIRELENAVVRAAAICDGTIRVKDLPESVRSYRRQFTVNGFDSSNDFPAGPDAAKSARAPELIARDEWPELSIVEGRYVALVLVQTGGNKQAAARLLGIDRKTLDRMIKRHSINVKDSANPH
ncbi:MAG TPA: sigma-54 dependent transcriptional regulator [Pyrinomonadaceae bacterium]|nr:sigma-54 dependent transcriptional regulator [Pyrinomonadaceae bacterium]